MRAYLRVDPNLPDHIEGYPDGACAAFGLTLCFGEHQPKRGRFRNRAVLGALLGRRARWIDFLISQGDLIEYGTGEIYFDGWDEWQEGDWKVSERMRRVRERKHHKSVTAAVTDDVTVGNVTDLSIAVGGRHLAVGGKAVGTRQSANADVLRVFDAWKESTGHHRAVLDVKRQRLIERALRDYPIEDVLVAIDGWRFSPHHRGENDRQTTYNDLELILRDSKHIEQFRDFATRPPVEVAIVKPSLSRSYREMAAQLRVAEVVE